MTYLSPCLRFTHSVALFAHTIAATALIACGNSNPGSPDSAVLDSTVSDARADGTVHDTMVPDTSALDSTTRDSALRDVPTSDANAYGFVVEAPSSVSLNTSRGAMDFPSKSFGCTLRARGNNAIVYLHAIPTGVFEGGIVPIPVFANVRAWVYDRQAMMTRSVPAEYEWGGGHHNDFFTITLSGSQYRFDHSSFGFGFRACRPVDCVRVISNGTEIENGCTAQRTLPEICRELDSTAFPALDTDTFARCPGDPNG